MKPPVFDPSWSDEVCRIYEHDQEELWDASRPRYLRNRYRNLLEHYRGFAHRLRPRSVLDIGCAQATLALTLAEDGYRVVASDLRAEFLEYAKTRYERGDIRFVAGNVFELNLNEQFDLVYANQIIEHLVHPVDFLAKLRGFVAPGGHLVVATPNHGFLMSRLPSYDELGDVTQYEHKQFTADADGHFFAYRPSELQKFFRDAGFQVESVHLFETPWASGHMKVRYLHAVLPYRVLRGMEGLTKRLPWIGPKLCHQLIVCGRRVAS